VCPATGFGLSKALTDVDALANDCVPRWLSSSGMGEEKIAEFYRAPTKVATDRRAITNALHQRRLAIDPSFPWRFRRARTFGAMWLRGRAQFG
jgi:hypothetical protein